MAKFWGIGEKSSIIQIAEAKDWQESTTRIVEKSSASRLLIERRTLRMNINLSRDNEADVSCHVQSILTLKAHPS